MKRVSVATVGWVCALSLGACGGGDSDASVSGTLTGLGSGQTVTIQDNTAANLTLSANGTFVAATGVGSGGTYSIVVVTQPTGQTCTVTNGSGTVSTAGDDVTNVAVTCVTTSSLVAVVSGLPSGTSVTLSNGTTLLPIASNGEFAFPGVLAAGAAYAVTVAVQPAGHACSLAGGTGTIGSTGSALITVTCI